MSAEHGTRLLYDTNISQGDVDTYLRCDGIFMTTDAVLIDVLRRRVLI